MSKNKTKKLFESRFLIPFYLNARSCKDPVFSKDWVDTQPQENYIGNYVFELFSVKNPVCTIKNFKDGNRRSYGMPNSNEKVFVSCSIMQNEPETFSFNLNKISLFFCCETSTGILILDIIHDNDESLQTITDKSFALTHMFSSYSKGIKSHSKVSFKYMSGQTEKQLDLVEFFKSLFPSDSGYDYQLFKDMSNIKCNVYHRLLLNHRFNDEDLKNIMLLSRGLHSSTDFANHKDLLNENIFYSSGGNCYWMVDNVGAVSVSFKESEEVPGTRFLTEIHPENVNNHYLPIYLLALHEKITLLNYNYMAVHYWNNPKMLKTVKDKLLSFNIKFSYNVISDETNYQVFYEKISSVMKINLLENDIQEVLDKVAEDQREQQDQRLNALLASLAVLAVFSALTDSYSFVTQVKEEVALPHLILFAVIAFFIGLGVFLYFRKKK